MKEGGHSCAAMKAWVGVRCWVVGFWVLGFGFWVLGFGFAVVVEVLGFGFWVGVGV